MNIKDYALANNQQYLILREQDGKITVMKACDDVLDTLRTIAKFTGIKVKESSNAKKLGE